MTATTSKVRILIVDDHRLLREGLHLLLSRYKNFMVCGEAENPEEALRAVESHKPDLAIVDISLRGDKDGIDLLGVLKQRYPDLPVVVLSLHEEPVYRQRALEAGADCYLSKTGSIDGLFRGIETALKPRPAAAASV